MKGWQKAWFAPSNPRRNPGKTNVLAGYPGKVAGISQRFPVSGRFENEKLVFSLAP